MARDPITNKPSNGSGSPNRPDANRNKSLPSKGPAYVGNDLKGWPSPADPYKGK